MAGRLVIVKRLAALMRLAERRGPLPPQVVLAKQYNVHPRTILRDLQALESAGLRVQRAERWEWAE